MIRSDLGYIKRGDFLPGAESPGHWWNRCPNTHRVLQHLGGAPACCQTGDGGDKSRGCSDLSMKKGMECVG